MQNSIKLKTQKIRPFHCKNLRRNDEQKYLDPQCVEKQFQPHQLQKLRKVHLLRKFTQIATSQPKIHSGLLSSLKLQN
jgi:hypothetical protein